MKTCGWHCSAKTMAVVLLRWALGILFLVAGITKLRMLDTFVRVHLMPSFEKTFLPTWLLEAYGYALPFVETLLGALLIVGLFRTGALFLTGLTLISLAFGQMLVQGHGTVANILFYLLMTAAALYGQEHDTWGVCLCRRRPAGQPAVLDNKEPARDDSGCCVTVCGSASAPTSDALHKRSEYP